MTQFEIDMSHIQNYCKDIDLAIAKKLAKEKDNGKNNNKNEISKTNDVLNYSARQYLDYLYQNDRQ